MSVAPGESDTGNNFVDQYLGTIGDFVWNDLNMDGVQDADEPGIGGATLGLYDSAGQLLAMTTTAADGSYQFTGYPAGTYTVIVTDSSLPLGFLPTYDLDGVATEHTATFVLAAGEGRSDVDYGYAMPLQCNACAGKVDSLTMRYQGSLADAHIVVIEKDGQTVFDGIVQPGGQFSFVGLDAGKKMTFGTEIGIYINGALDVTIHTSCSQLIGPGLVAGEFIVVHGTSHSGGQLCPIDGISPGSISGLVTEDTDGDGVGDTALAGVTLTLLDSEGSSLGTTTSAADGSYSFTDLPPGDYTVVETQPTGFGSVLDQDQTPDGDTQDSDTTVDDQVGVNLISGEDDADNNFVEVNNVCVPESAQSQYGWNGNETGTLNTNIAWNYAMGYHFTPQVDGQVTELGGYFNGSKTVKLFNRSTGELLATTTVSSSNNWNYGAITPVNVTAGTEYTAAVYLAGSGASYRSSITALPQTFGDIQITATTYASTSSDSNARPTNAVTTVMYGQADITFVVN